MKEIFEKKKFKIIDLGRIRSHFIILLSLNWLCYEAYSYDRKNSYLYFNFEHFELGIASYWANFWNYNDTKYM